MSGRETKRKKVLKLFGLFDLSFTSSLFFYEILPVRGLLLLQPVQDQKQPHGH